MLQSMNKIQLGVERKAKMQFDRYATLDKLITQLAERRLILFRWRTYGELAAEVRANRTLPVSDLLSINYRFADGIYFADKLLHRTVHADKKTTLAIHDEPLLTSIGHCAFAHGSTLQPVDVISYRQPPPEVEVADAEIGSLDTWRINDSMQPAKKAVVADIVIYS